MTISLFPTLKTEWIAPDVFPDLSSAEAIAIDLETCDPGMNTSGPGWATKNGYIVGFALAVDGWKGYFPIRHGGGGNLDEKRVRKFVQTVLDLPCDKIFFNAAYDVGWLKAEGFTINGRIIDAMIAAALIDENRFSYSLNALGFDYLQETKSEQGLRDAAKEFGVDPKKELYKLPAMYVGEYAEQDAALTLKLWQFFKIEMIKQELTPIFDLETALCPHLIDMTLMGVRFDMDQAQRTMEHFRRVEKDALAKIKTLSGYSVDIWAAASIAKAFDKLGIDYPKTEKGAPSFTKQFLAHHKHPIAQAIVDAREYNKATGTFIEGLMGYAKYDGRIHGHINQLRSDEGGTVSGRLSMANPNLQQIPARHPEIGPAIRKLFLPEEGEIWASLDFSQQEPRLAVHYAKLLDLKGADKAAEAYINDLTTDFHQMVADMAGIGRKQAKTCIAQGQLVLTDKGLVPIEKITLLHKLWDGIEWVTHEGVAFMGHKETITYGNLTATPDHDVWTVQSGKIPFWLAASRLDALISTGNAEQALRYMDCYQPRNTTPWKASIRQSALRLWQRGLEVIRQLKERKIHNVPQLCYQEAARKERSFSKQLYFYKATSSTGVRNISTMQQPERPCLQRLRWSWNNLLFSFRKRLGGLFVKPCRSGKMGWENYRSHRQQPGLPEREYSDSHLSGKQHESSKLEKVYDIINAGPRNRFTVSNHLVSNCSLGIMYGMGKGKLAAELDLPESEASDLIRQYHDRVPFMKGLITAVQQRIDHPASNGSVRTLLGRRCRFNLWEPPEFGLHKPLPREQAVLEYGPRLKRAYTYKGLNRLIQGSAADQTKKSMLACVEAGKLPLLQVHDELCLSVESVEKAREYAQAMMDCVKLEVPSKVDVECGPSWGEAA